MKYPETSKKEVDVTGISGAVKIGCRTDKGMIIPQAFKFRAIEGVPENVLWADYSVSAESCFAMSDGTLYAAPLCKKFVAVTEVDGEPFMLEEYDGGRRKTFVVSGEKYAVFDGETHSVNAFRCGIYAGVTKCGRLFGVDSEDKTLVRWTGTDGINDLKESIEGAGWMRLEGAFGNVLNLVVAGDYLVAVREYGLTAISAFGAPENFRQINAVHKAPRIFKNTAVAINGKLYFYTVKGLYCFDGNKIAEVFADRRGMLNTPTYAVAYGQNYCVCGFSAALGREAVLIYETSGGAAYFADIPAKTLCAHNGLIAFTAAGAYISEAGGEYTFESGEINFGDARKKTLTGIEILGGTADIEVTNGVVSRILRGVNGFARVNLRGNHFKITLKGKEKLGAVKAFAEVGYGI